MTAAASLIRRLRQRAEDADLSNDDAILLEQAAAAIETQAEQLRHADEPLFLIEPLEADNVAV